MSRRKIDWGKHPVASVVVWILTAACVIGLLYTATHLDELPTRRPGGGRGKNHLAALMFVFCPVVLAVTWGIFLRNFRGPPR